MVGFVVCCSSVFPDVLFGVMVIDLPATSEQKSSN
jgi:hypothetical protein